MTEIERDELLKQILRLNHVGSAGEVGRSGLIVLPTPSGAAARFDLHRATRDQRELLNEYWTFHPRFRYFKSLKYGARMVDMGAASGGLPGWREWGKPSRRDLKLFAVDVKTNDAYKAYDDYDIVDLNTKRTKFLDGSCDAFLLSHLVEHVEDRGTLFRECARLSTPSSVMYIEWPTLASARALPRDVLSRVGIEAGTTNFFDDATHLSVLPSETIIAEMEEAGFRCRERGDIRNDYIQDELFALAYKTKDVTMMTYALWLAFGFSEYIIADRA